MFKAFLQCLFAMKVNWLNRNKQENIGIKNVFSLNLETGNIPEPN